MWKYSQSTGILSRGDAAFQCYAGRGEGKNSPAMQGVPFVGPLCRGAYDMAELFDSTAHGPACIRLVAREPNARGGFLIHGDNAKDPGNASKGCICRSPRADRLAIWNSGDRVLEVLE